MAIREIRKIGDDILRKKSREVTEFDSRLHALLDDMRETLMAANGAGLAAPQVGVLRRAVIIYLNGEMTELINPVIIKRGGGVTENEGCLSVPGRSDPVQRPAHVKVKAFDRFGDEFVMKSSGWFARAVCHEIDHLDGVLYIDHIKN